MTRRFEFSAKIERIERGGPYYAITIPAAVSKAFGRRGPVPVIALINRVSEVRASAVPCGGGRHRLRLNAAVRRVLEANEGARVAVALSVDENPTADPIPPDLLHALDEVGALAAFQKFAVGRKNHIFRWIEEAARETTRERRIARILEATLVEREGADDSRSGNDRG